MGTNMKSKITYALAIMLLGVTVFVACESNNIPTAQVEEDRSDLNEVAGLIDQANKAAVDPADYAVDPTENPCFNPDSALARATAHAALYKFEKEVTEAALAAWPEHPVLLRLAERTVKQGERLTAIQEALGFNIEILSAEVGVYGVDELEALYPTLVEGIGASEEAALKAVAYVQEYLMLGFVAKMEARRGTMEAALARVQDGTGSACDSAMVARAANRINRRQQQDNCIGIPTEGCEGAVQGQRKGVGAPMILKYIVMYLDKELGVTYAPQLLDAEQFAAFMTRSNRPNQGKGNQLGQGGKGGGKDY